MKKLALALLLLILLIILYVIDLYFHFGYTLWLFKYIWSPEFLLLAFLVIITPYYLKNFNLITKLESDRGISLGTFYYLDKITASLLLIGCSFVLILICCSLLTGGMFLYLFFLPKWWLVLLIPSCIPELIMQKRKLKKLKASKFA